MRIIKDLIPFQQETAGSNRLRKILSFALIIGILQTFSWTYQIVEAPQAKAVSTYAPSGATSVTIPTGVSSITFTMYGGGGGNGGLDCGAGCTLKTPGARGKVTGTFTVVSGDVIGIFPGNAGSSGTGSTNGGGGSGGADTYSDGNYNGGAGGNAGSAGSSGGGGGGGAASVLTKNSTVWAVAGGAAGAGGAANLANSGQNGYDTNASNTGVTNGGDGVQTQNSTNNGAGKSCTNQTNDGGGGGGGGGGVNGGSGGNLTNAGSGECSGLAGYRGGNSLNAAITSTTDGTDSSANTSNGSIEITMQLTTPSSVSVTPTSNTYGSISVSWATAAAAQSFNVKLYNSVGSTLLATKSISSGTYSTIITSSDFASIANGVQYQVSVTAIGNSGAPYVDSSESSKVSVTTNAPTGATSDTDTAITLNATSGNHLYATDNSLVRFPETFTAQAWIYPTNFGCKGGAASPWSSNDGYCHIVSKGGLFSLLTASSSNTTDAGVRAGQLGFNWNGVKFSKYVLNLNEWHHVAFSREGTGSGLAKLYVDGNLIYSDTATANAADATRDFTIGASRSDSANSNSIYGTFIGRIDEVKLSKRYRTQIEIQYDLHHHNVTDSSFNLYYDFNENSGTKVFNRATGATSSSDLSFIGSNNFDSQKIYQVDTTTASAYTIVKFYRDYLVNANGWTSPANVNSMRYLVVGGGGGGGGGWNGGGGGAGGYRETNTAISPNTVYNIEVGVGGNGALFQYGPSAGGATTLRINGVDTSSISASGGGSGGTEQNVAGGPITGATNGGSGGGGVHAGGVSPGTGNSGSYSPVEGYRGGNGASASGIYAGGGGGGAGAVGGDATSSTSGVPGNGGAGVTTYITGSAINLAGGGAGAGRFAPSVTYVKHGSATHGGGSGSCADPCTSTDTGTSGTVNTGGGGGAGASTTSGAAMGGSGGSGFIVIKYITNKPTIITQPISDTSTVGAFDTFTVTTSGAPSPLTKTVQWQFTTDSRTGTSTGWTNLSTGTGFRSDPIENSGSASFNGSTQYLTVPNNGDFAFGTGDFTIELWAYRNSDVSSYPRLFSLGTWPSAYVALELGGSGQLWVHWKGHRDRQFGNPGLLLNQWVHYAMVRSAGMMHVYVNGVEYGTAESATDNIDDSSSPMYVAKENSSGTSFAGQLTNFHVMKGVAKYTSNFTPSTTPISSVASTVTLLKFSNADGLLTDSGPNAKTITNGGSTAWNAGTPFASGSGGGNVTDTYTTPVLTKSWNNYQLRAIVTFSDSLNLSTIETSSAVLLIVNDSITITSDTSTITRKYGDTQTVRSIAYSGGTTSTGAVGTSTSHTVNTPFGALANGKIYVDTSTSTARFKVDTGTAVGTYYETVTVTDFKGAISSYTQKVVVNPADTLTVQADTLTAITYNPNGMTINPTASYTGLVNSDTQSAITLTFKSSTLASCATGGLCNLGDTGPGGGTIFYDAGSTQSWGRYIEASPIDWYTVAKGGNGTENVTWCSNTNYFITGLVDAIGYGLANKQTMAASCDLASGYKNTASGMLWVTNGGAPGGYSGGGKTDWFLPSLSEMDALNNYSGGSLLPQKYYWIAENTNATISPTPAYSCCSQSWPYRAIGGATKSSAYPIRPMRYVTPDLSLTSYNSTTPPTNAGTYTINPSSLVLANNVDTSNYVSVIYRSSTFVINKAVQDSLTITSKLAPYNGGTSTMKLTTIGGTDTGTVTYAIVSGGSASGCSVSTNVLSFTSAGTCKVVATKAATLNYLVIYSDTVTITLSQFVSNQPVQTQQYPNQIPINGKNSLDTTTVTIPDVTSVTSTGAGTYTIVGTGFTGVSRVVIGGTAVTISSSNATSINISGAAGLTGPLIIECSDGRMGPVPFWLIL